MMSFIAFRHRRRLPHTHNLASQHLTERLPARWLADLHAGEQARILSFSPAMPPDRLAQLQSYGLLPDIQIVVLQSWPVFVVQVEHTELAVENDLARQISIRSI